jgi:hypothetical protein
LRAAGSGGGVITLGAMRRPHAEQKRAFSGNS